MKESSIILLKYSSRSEIINSVVIVKFTVYTISTTTAQHPANNSSKFIQTKKLTINQNSETMKNRTSYHLKQYDDPNKNKLMENELLQLKLKAELGIDAHISENTPPLIKNLFLKNILAFEKGLAQSEEIRIFELIGEPKFEPEVKLNDMSIKKELKNLMDLLNHNQISLDFLGSYDCRTKYKFLTEELFEEKVIYAQIPGMIIHFIYEEFHPNHQLDIENKTKKFINSLLRKDNEHLSFSLTDVLVLPEGTVWKKEKVLDKFFNIFQSYPQFKNEKFEIEDIHIELKKDTALGLAEGLMRYNATTESNEVIEFEGPFKLYFILEYEWWSIYYFVIPGFEFTDD